MSETNNQVDLKRMLQRRGLSTDLPILETGEIGLTTDNNGLFIGNNNKNIIIVTESSIVDDFNSTSNKKVLSAKKGSELKAQLDELQDLFNGSNVNVNDELNNKQDLIIHVGENPPTNTSMLWFDTTD